MNVLLIARHFPPLVSGGARRPYLLALALEALGAEVRVVAPGLPPGVKGVVAPLLHAPPLEQADAPPVPAPPPTLSARLRDLARSWLLWPDAEIRWVRRAVRAAGSLEGFRPDWILTTSPPESIHCAGPALRRRHQARWVADLRDEWLARPFRAELSHPWRRMVEGVIARRLLVRADLIIGVDAVVAREARRLAPGRPIEVLAQFAAPPPPPVDLGPGGVHVLYTGSVSLSDPACGIEPLCAAIAATVRRRSDLVFHFVGRLTPEERAALRATGAGDAVRLHGPRPYDETRAMQAAADGFLVTAAPDATAIPGKVYEYRAVGAPIIAVGEGPWRAIGGYDPGDAADRLSSLAKRRPGERDGPVADTPEDAARRLLAMMRAVVRG
ncbi:hypothetical protein ASD21_10755 [Caulobacter sp. Root1455]|uniref:glycosyltransferase n=1 Tax=unclassified Caulobacter TaxID=2648921 RepID=UPI0006F32062|nr:MULTISPECIES: glycosyltransferase [unclassified Caulobacter]KQY35267.1 hypothetical protein ASD38_01480 [Caulobacter sp. Root487D2Y]KQY93243.1 hypothetical protein ASD21_10755 [Caulobacter sp. Root1455]